MYDYPEDVFVLNRWLLKIAGLWPPEPPSKFIKIYKMYTVLIFIYVDITFALTEFISLFVTFRRLSDFIKNINFFLTHLMGSVKVIFWFRNKDVLKKLMDELENREFRYRTDLNGFKPGLIIRKYKRIGIIFGAIFFSMPHINLSAAYLPPAFITIFGTPQNENGTVPELYQMMPYFSWMPFKYDTPKKYLFALFFQWAPVYLYGYHIVAMDTLFMNLMNFIAAHLTVLQGAFKTNVQRARETLRDVNVEMKKTCRHLQLIFRVSEELEWTYKYLLLGQATATLFILCTSLYLVATTPIGSKEFGSEIIYLFSMGFQLFLYCWFGNEVTLKAKELPDYIWKSDWLLCDLQYKKSMVLTILRMQKPIYLTLGQFAPLTLDTFVAILKGSYSAFAVIQNN